MPVAYLAGEESALIAYLDGRPLKPTVVPPRPFERGLRRRPTLVQNPETLAHLALIDRHGPRGSGRTAPTTIRAPPWSPCPARCACAASRRSPAARRSPRFSTPPATSSSPCAPSSWAVATASGSRATRSSTVTLDDAQLARHGGSLGAGVIVALGQSACPVQELAHAIGYLAEQSAGQCGPCTYGLPAISELLSAMASGRAVPGAHLQLDRWSADLPGRGACHLPDGAMRVLRSGMRVFAQRARRP